MQRVGARGAAPGQRGQSQRGIRGARGGSTPSRTVHSGSDKNLYVHLLALLRKENLLPVVVFTLSKKRCEENAATLTNADICNVVEKSEVHIAIERALNRLTGRNLFHSKRTII